jgi:hypothetical protein
LKQLKGQNGTLKTSDLQANQVANRKPSSLALGSFAHIFACSPGFAAKKYCAP